MADNSGSGTSKPDKPKHPPPPPQPTKEEKIKEYGNGLESYAKEIEQLKSNYYKNKKEFKEENIKLADEILTELKEHRKNFINADIAHVNELKQIKKELKKIPQQFKLIKKWVEERKGFTTNTFCGAETSVSLRVVLVTRQGPPVFFKPPPEGGSLFSFSYRHSPSFLPRPSCI